MTVQWGILSTARINDKFLAGLAGSRTGRAVAVASRDAARGRAYARERGIPRVHDSYDALLQDPDVEAVYVSLPNALHLEWTRRALEAGKHVLCEKPLGRRAADVEAIFDVAERAGRLLMEAFMYRHHPQTARLVALMGAGAIGRLRVVRSSFGFNLTDSSDVRLSRDLEGGALMDVGCYCVSATRLLAGEAEQVSGQTLIGGDGVDIAFAGLIRCPHGVLAHFDAGLVFADRYELEVVGDEATLRVADPWHCRNPGIELRRDDSVKRIDVPAANPYTLEADNFAAAIRGEAAPLLDRADAVSQARTIEALYAAAETGLPTGV
ncbi:MAG TPA: Gfo/Idh/MocA family oxidoreductase [Solirubrobacteraceae bacterium]|nr:Gfo/Idh/MocA family oxidoreductase [Solirubrobacteraceae bacterium]